LGFLAELVQDPSTKRSTNTHQRQPALTSAPMS
jgi:hypothetical protein